jgi:RNA polymerase sigma-70 factor, ECF subfamily
MRHRRRQACRTVRTKARSDVWVRPSDRESPTLAAPRCRGPSHAPGVGETWPPGVIMVSGVDPHGGGESAPSFEQDECVAQGEVSSLTDLPLSQGAAFPNGTQSHQWLDRLRRDDAGALEELLDCYWVPLVRYARGLRGARDEGDTAEDAAQEAFVRLWAGRHRWGGEGSATGLLYKIVRNLCLNERRRTANHHRLAPTAWGGVRQATPLDHLEASEVERAVARTLSTMPARRREVFELSRYHGLSYREIANALEISPQTVANQLSAALDELHGGISGHPPRGGGHP